MIPGLLAIDHPVVAENDLVALHFLDSTGYRLLLLAQPIGQVADGEFRVLLQQL